MPPHSLGKGVVGNDLVVQCKAAVTLCGFENTKVAASCESKSGDLFRYWRSVHQLALKQGCWVRPALGFLDTTKKESDARNAVLRFLM